MFTFHLSYKIDKYNIKDIILFIKCTNEVDKHSGELWYIIVGINNKINELYNIIKIT